MQRLSPCPFVGVCVALLSSACSAPSSSQDPNDSAGTEMAESGAGTSSTGTGSMAGAGGSSVGGGGTQAQGGPSGGSAGTAGQGGGAAGHGGGAAGHGGGAAGSGGGDMPLPKKVGDCNDLGRVDEFQDITPAAAIGKNFAVSNVLFDPVNVGTIYAGTDHAGLWKSTDCGSTWVKADTGRDADILDGGTLWTMVLDPIDPQVIYLGSFQSGDGSLLKSVDGGKNFDSVWRAGSVIPNTAQYNALQGLAIDPDDHAHLLATIHANCRDPNKVGQNLPFDTSCLAETTDSGATWRAIKGPTSGWSEGASVFIFERSHLSTRRPRAASISTSNGGQSWATMPVNGANTSIYRTPDGHAYLGSDYGIDYVSPDGSVWKKIEGSPVGFPIIGDGTRLFTGRRFLNGQTTQPYYTAPANLDTKWTAFSSPNMKDGPVEMRYDPDHHLLYSANMGSGLWRLVTH